MMVVLSLLFLPAALISGTWAHYWSVQSMNGDERVFACEFRGLNVFMSSWAARSGARSVRLASRSGLFGCSVVGLLFLSAARTGSQGLYWSVYGGVYKGILIGSGPRIEDGLLNPSFGPGRNARQPVRLASRSELFG